MQLDYVTKAVWSSRTSFWVQSEFDKNPFRDLLRSLTDNESKFSFIACIRVLSHLHDCLTDYLKKRYSRARVLEYTIHSINILDC